MGLSVPHTALLGQGVWEGSLPATVVSAVKCKAPMQGGRLRAKQDMLWGREGLTVKEKTQVVWGGTLTTDIQQWPSPATLYSCPPHKSMPGVTQVPATPLPLQSHKEPFQQPHPCLSPSLPPRAGPHGGESLKDASPGPRKVLSRWHAPSPLQHTCCVNW